MRERKQHVRVGRERAEEPFLLAGLSSERTDLSVHLMNLGGSDETLQDPLRSAAEGLTASAAFWTPFRRP